MFYKIITTPIGNISIFTDNTGLKAVKFETSKNPKYSEQSFYSNDLKANYQGFEQSVQIKKCKQDLTMAKSICLETEKQLLEYFSGKRKIFDLPLSPDGTDFQKLVWKYLYTIPYGKLVSYKMVAQGINKPQACRAVGNANGKNPISIIIPCHRVITSDKKIGGYSSGLKIKKYLLNLEKAMLVDNLL